MTSADCRLASGNQSTTWPLQKNRGNHGSQRVKFDTSETCQKVTVPWVTGHLMSPVRGSGISRHSFQAFNGEFWMFQTSKWCHHPSSTMRHWVLWLCLCLFYAYFNVLLICLQNIWMNEWDECRKHICSIRDWGCGARWLLGGGYKSSYLLTYLLQESCGRRRRFCARTTRRDAELNAEMYTVLPSSATRSWWEPSRITSTTSHPEVRPQSAGLDLS